MTINREIEETLQRCDQVPHDLKDIACRQLCDSLTALSWKVLAASGNDGQVSEDVVRAALGLTAKFPPLSSRIYEVGWLYRLRTMVVHPQFNPEHALALLQDELATHAVPSKPNLILQGLCEYKIRGLMTAQYFFLRANQEYISDSIITSFSSYSRSVCPINSVSRFDLLKTFNEISKGDGSTWIMVAANSKYITKYLRNYVDSIVTRSSNVGLHVHWIQERDDVSEDAGALNALDYARSRLHDLFESTREVCPNVKDKRSYFASSRFLIANELLSRKAQMIITDIDYEVVGDLSELISFCSKFDVALQVREQGLQSYFPWLKVVAGTVVVNNSPLGRGFLAAYSVLFKRIFVGSGFNWGIDQNILCALYDELKHLHCIGNSLRVDNPFRVPYAIKRAI